MAVFMSQISHLDDLEVHGHAMVRDLVAADMLAHFLVESVRLASDYPDQAHGIRSLLRRSPVIAAWARSDAVLALLPPRMQPVRAILFDKTPATNWKVAWHQDLTIAVQEKQDIPGHGPWSVKEGTVHVQPPMGSLENMITLRLHLDETPEKNGALKMIPGSHRYGRLDAEAIARLRESTPEHICEAGAGDVLLMKPLILHASSASAEPGHRRVVHVEYAPPGLLAPALRWAEA